MRLHVTIQQARARRQGVQCWSVLQTWRDLCGGLRGRASESKKVELLHCWPSLALLGAGLPSGKPVAMMYICYCTVGPIKELQGGKEDIKNMMEIESQLSPFLISEQERILFVSKRLVVHFDFFSEYLSYPLLD